MRRDGWEAKMTEESDSCQEVCRADGLVGERPRDDLESAVLLHGHKNITEDQLVLVDGRRGRRGRRGAMCVNVPCAAL